MRSQIKHIHTVYLTHSATFISDDVKKRSQVILTIQAQGRQGAGGRGWGWWAGTGWQLAQTPTSSSTLTPPRQPPHPIRFIAGQTFQFLSRMITVRDPSPFPPAFLLLHPCSHPLLWTQLTWNEKNMWGQVLRAEHWCIWYSNAEKIIGWKWWVSQFTLLQLHFGWVPFIAALVKTECTLVH